MEGKHYVGSLTAAERQYEENKAAAINSGYDPSEGGKTCADFVLYVGHGYRGSLSICYATDPAIVWNLPPRGPEWNREVEFVAFSVCGFFGENGVLRRAGGPPEEWFNPAYDYYPGSRPFATGLHAVLGTCGTVYHDEIDDDMPRFVNALGAGHKVVDAWETACLKGNNSLYVSTHRDSNESDLVCPGGCLSRDSLELATKFVVKYYKNKVEEYDQSSN